MTTRNEGSAPTLGSLLPDCLQCTQQQCDIGKQRLQSWLKREGFAYLSVSDATPDNASFVVYGMNACDIAKLPPIFDGFDLSGTNREAGRPE